MLDHEKELENENIKHLKSLHEEQTHSYKREEQLKNELDFLKTSFHSYRVKFLYYTSSFFSFNNRNFFYRSILIKKMRKNFRLKLMKH